MSELSKISNVGKTTEKTLLQWGIQHLIVEGKNSSATLRRRESVVRRNNRSLSVVFIPLC